MIGQRLNLLGVHLELNLRGGFAFPQTVTLTLVTWIKDVARALARSLSCMHPSDLDATCLCPCNHAYACQWGKGPEGLPTRWDRLVSAPVFASALNWPKNGFRSRLHGWLLTGA